MAVLLKRFERPRELKWFQAGAMLYGDLGTSKAYVLGIAFALAGHASWFFLGMMSLLTLLVGICYTIVCRVYPDGGGVYSSAKHYSQSLAIFGGLLLIADYVVTAALSALDAFHYFNVPNPVFWACIAILIIGLINWFGPTKGGNIAGIIAIVAFISATILFFFTIPSLPQVKFEMPKAGFLPSWTTFVGIVLALSGVESIANMTGIMVHPVEKTSKRAIWPVVLEVSLLTFLLGIGMNAIPGLTNHTEDMLKVLGNHYVNAGFGCFISIVFGFVLLSATNTAISGLVSIQFLLAKDKELPQVFGRLNRFGMPSLALIVSVLIPILVLVFEQDIIKLSVLYAIGMVGAIVVNLGGTVLNKNISMKKRERAILWVAVVILTLIEITIAVQRRNALIFVVTVIGIGLALRYLAKTFIPAPIPELPAINVLTITEAREIMPLYRSSSLVAIKVFNPILLQEAALRVKAKGENSLYLNYVEENQAFSELPSEVEPGQEALEVLDKAQKELERKGITAIPIWQLGKEPGKLIARAARELRVETVLIGATRRSALEKIFRGDLLRVLSRHLPRECHLLITG